MRSSSMRWAVLVGTALAYGCATSAPHQRAPFDDSVSVELGERGAPPGASADVAAAEEHLASGRLDEAEQALRAILERSDDARAWFDLGLVHEARGRAAEAIAAYRRALDRVPAFVEAAVNLSSAQLDADAASEARSVVEATLRAGADHAALHENRGLACEALADLACATESYTEALGRDGARIRARVNLGLLRLREGEQASALEHLRSALEVVGEERAWLLAIGNGLRRAGDAPAAVIAMRRAVRAGDDPPTPAILAELALAEHAAGQPDAAIATLRRAIDRDANYATAHFLLGSLLAGTGERDAARTALREYLRIAPNGDFAARARAHLERLDGETRPQR